MPITGFVSSCLGIAVSNPFDPATSAWVAAVIANGGTVSAGRQSLVDALIRGLKFDGVWANLDRLWILAAENQPSALTDMVALVLAATAGSPAFATDRGFTGVDASTTVYIDTNTNLSTYGGQFINLGGHVSAWSNTDAVSSGTGGAIMGIKSGSADETSIFPWFADGNAYFRCLDAVPNATGLATSHSLGHFVSNRSTGSTTEGYVNGSLGINPNTAHGALGNGNITILAINNIGTGIVFGTGNQITMASIGGNLVAGNVTSFYNRLRTYMTAVGVS